MTPHETIMAMQSLCEDLKDAINESAIAHKPEYVIKSMCVLLAGCVRAGSPNPDQLMVEVKLLLDEIMSGKFMNMIH